MNTQEKQLLGMVKEFNKAADGHPLRDVLVAAASFIVMVMKDAEPTLDHELAANGLIAYITDILEGERELRKEDKQ